MEEMKPAKLALILGDIFCNASMELCGQDSHMMSRVENLFLDNEDNAVKIQRIVEDLFKMELAAFARGLKVEIENYNCNKLVEELTGTE